MSDAPTKTKSSSKTGQQTQPQATSKPRRFLDAFGRGAASVKRRKERSVESVGETLTKVTNFVTYTLLDTDYERRRKRFDTLKKEVDADKRLGQAQKTAAWWTKIIDNAVKDPKADWTARATACTMATEDVLADMKEARQAEKTAREAYPAVRDQLDLVSDALDAAKLHLTPEQHGTFSAALNGLQLKLCELAPVKPAKNAPPPPLAGEAARLSEQITQAITANANRQNELRAVLNPLKGRLAASSETGDGDQRLVVSQLLTVADNAIFAFDFQAAEEALETAKSTLDQMNAPTVDQLPKPQDLLDGMAVVRREGGRLQKATKTLPSAVADPLHQRATAVLEQLVAMEYALGKSGQAVIADVNRVVEGCVSDLIEIDQAIKDYGTFETSRGTADTTFTQTFERVEQEAAKYYEALGVAGGGDGAFQTRLKGIRARWTEAMENSVSMAELNLDSYLQLLGSLSAEMQNTPGKPGDVALEKAGSRFRAALETLEAEADRVIGIDSDKALKLGLTTKPASLKSAGEVLLSSKSASMDPAERVRKLDLVTQQMTTLSEQAKAFDGKAALEEATRLREMCERQADEVRRRVEKVLSDVETERKKLVSIGTNKEERDGLTKYGTSLLADLATVLAPLGGLKSDAPLDAGLLGDAIHDLATLLKRVTDFESLGPKGKTDKSIPSFDSLKTRADKLNKTLTTSSLLAPRAELTEPWRTALDKILGDLTGRDPRATDAQLLTLEQAVANALVEAKKESKAASDKALQLRNLAADVTLGRGGLSVLATMPTYRKDLDARLEKMATDILAADKVDPAAETLIAEVGRAAATGPEGVKARSEGDAKAQEAQKAYDAARAALNQVLEVELELLGETAGKLKGEAKTALSKQVKDLRQQAEAALKTLEINRDADAATAMADAIKERVARIADSPLGSTVRARNQLPQAEARWRKAVETLHTQLDKIPGAVTPLCAGDSVAETAADAVPGKLVDPVKTLFRADAFAAVLKRIEVADDAGLLEAREEALREVRRLTAMMSSDNRVHLLSKVPFPGTVTPFPEIGAALWDLETNLMTAG